MWGKNRGSGLEEIVSLFNIVFASVDRSIQWLLKLFSFPFFIYRSILSRALLVSAKLVTRVRAVTTEKYIILFITRLEQVNTKAVLNYWILEFFFNWTFLRQR
jgi:hypothetical protein